jgi:hypothetical protein
MGYASAAQRKAVWASKKDGGKGNPNRKKSATPFKMKSPLPKLSEACKRWAKSRYDVWPSAYASGAAVKRQKAGKC